jgi:transposase
MARQASAERAWASVSRFYENVKKGVKGRKVGFPKFQKDCRSVEYKTNSGKLADDRIAVLKKVRYALCPMPYALCPMPYAHEYLIFMRKAINQ